MSLQESDSPVSEMKVSSQISDYRYKRAMQNIILLRTMGEIDNSEVRRLISMLKSPDYENWTVAEETITNKLAIVL